MNTIHLEESLQLENGKVLSGLTIAYDTHGKLNVELSVRRKYCVIIENDFTEN